MGYYVRHLAWKKSAPQWKIQFLSYKKQDCDRGIDLYEGRKGFSDLMLSRGQALENISIWMGHSPLDRTWRSFKQRRRFHLGGF
jgi:hypothetical protein